MIFSLEYLTEDEWDDLGAISPPTQTLSINQSQLFLGN